MDTTRPTGAIDPPPGAASSMPYPHSGRRGRWRPMLASVLIVAGALMTLWCGRVAWARTGPYVLHGLDGPTYRIPLQKIPLHKVLDLQPGDYIVYARTGPPAGFTGNRVTGDYPVVHPRLDLRVADQNGRTYPTGGSPPGPPMGFMRGGGNFEALASFHVPEAGRYDVRIRSDVPTSVVIGRDLPDVFFSALGWLVGTAVGLSAFACGVIVFIRYGRPRRS